MMMARSKCGAKRHSQKHNIPKTGRIVVLTAYEATRLAMPRYNAFACGHGPHGDVKYNRAHEKRNWQQSENNRGEE